MTVRKKKLGNLECLLACFGIVVSTISCGSSGDTAPRVVLASIWEVTGQVAQYGEAANKGVKLAVDEYNAARALGEPDVRLIVQDTQSTSAGAASALQAALAQGRPIAVLGPLTSTAAMVIAPICEREKIVLITTASVPSFTNAGPFSYRIYPSDSFEALRMADTVKERGLRRGVIVYPQNEYGMGLDGAFHNAASTELTIVERIPYPADQSEFRTIASKIVAATPDFIYAPGYPATVGPLSKALRATGFRGGIYSGLGIEDPSLFELGGNAVDGILFTAPSIPQSSVNPVREGFEKRYRDTFYEAPTVPALYGFDVAQVVLSGIRGGARSATDLQKTLADGAAFTGATGRFVFDANGDVRRDYQIKRVNAMTRTFELLAVAGQQH